MTYSGVLRKCRKCGEAAPSQFKLRPDGTLSRLCRGCMYDAAQTVKQGRTRVVSFATKGAYEEEAKGLIESAHDFGVQVAVQIIEPRSWASAVAFKPAFMRLQFERFPDADGYLWVDADARFDGPPDFSIFDGAHLSYHRFKWSRTHPEEHLTGTLWIANTPTMRDFCETWADETRHYVETTDTPEQHSLKWTVEHYGARVAFKDCGPRYCWIEDDAFARVYESERDPVVVHFQASRKHRHLV